MKTNGSEMPKAGRCRPSLRVALAAGAASVAIVLAGISPLAASTSDAPPPPPKPVIPETKAPISDPTQTEFEKALGVPVEDAGGKLPVVEAEYNSVAAAMSADGYIVNPLVWDHETETIKIYTVRAIPTEQEEKRYRDIAAPFGFTLTITRVERSEAESLELQGRIDADRPELAKMGIQLGATGILGGGDTVQVDVYDGTESKASYLTERYGPAGLRIKIDAVSRPVQASRSSDFAPWYLGIRTWRPDNSETCTAGFSVTKPNHGPYMLSAGHCFQTTGVTIVYWWNINQYIGYSSQVDLVNNSPADSALITGSYFPYVWNSESTFLAQRTASSSDFVGQDSCFDGAVTLQVCRSYVTRTNVTLPFDTITTTGLVEAQTSFGQTICQPGDSGGPVYDASPGNGIRARGIIIGCTPHPNENLGYFMPWYRLAPRLGGLTLNTP